MKIEINGSNILRFDRNRHGEGLACYVRNGLSSAKRNYFPHDIEATFTEIFLPKTNHITVGIETMNGHFYQLDVINKESHILNEWS